MPKRKVRIRQAKIVEAFAKRMRAVREAKGITQRELANSAHVAITYISTLESGQSEPGIELVERLAAGLSVHMSELLPSPVAAESADEQRKQLKALFETVIGNAGRETLSLVNLFLARIAESPSVNR